MKFMLSFLGGIGYQEVLFLLFFVFIFGLVFWAIVKVVARIFAREVVRELNRTSAKGPEGARK